MLDALRKAADVDAPDSLANRMRRRRTRFFLGITAEHPEREIQRVGRSFLVQTPNRFFALEPHFLVPFFGILPATSRVWLLSHVRTRRAPVDVATTVMLHSNHRLLTRGELKLLFPGARIERERVAGLTTSFLVVSP